MPVKFTRTGDDRAVSRQLKINGQRYRSPLLPSKKAAREWEAEVRQAVKATGSPPKVTPTVSLIELSTKYLDHTQIRQPKTYSEKRNVLKRLVKHFGPDAPVTGIHPGAALEYLHAQKDAGFSPAKARKNLCAAWTWGSKYMPGFPKDNPFLAVEPFPVERRPRYVPPLADVEKVLDVASDQDLTMLQVFVNTGARRGEVYRLRWEDVNFEAGTIRLFCRKNRMGQLEPEDVPMNEDLAAVLANHKATAMSPEWVFVQPKGRFKGQPYHGEPGIPARPVRGLAGVSLSGFTAPAPGRVPCWPGKRWPWWTSSGSCDIGSWQHGQQYVRGLEISPARPSPP